MSILERGCLDPSCVTRESLLVKVVDAKEEPVPTAVVIVSCEQGPGQVTRGACVTDRNGLTPCNPEGTLCCHAVNDEAEEIGQLTGLFGDGCGDLPGLV